MFFCEKKRTEVTLKSSCEECHLIYYSPYLSISFKTLFNLYSTGADCHKVLGGGV